MIRRVAVPVFQARLRVVVDVGVHWNAVDRLVLWALGQSTRTPTDIAGEADLPPRLVNEIVFKLMRFGWVETAPDRRGVRATMAGLRVLHVEGELPSLAWPERRSVRVVIEPVEGRVFLAGQVWARRTKDVEAIAREHEVRWIELEDGMPLPSLEELGAAAQAALLNPEEEFIRVIPERSSMDIRFVVATVHGDVVEGLPADVSPRLLESVRRAARSGKAESRVVVSRVPRAAGAVRPCVSGVAMKPEDIVLDGPAHRELIRSVLQAARHRVVLHSTFLSLKGFESLREDLRIAARNGASIDLVYGADKDEKTRKEAREQALAITAEIQKDSALRYRARMHVRSTVSHAKLLIADEGNETSFVAVVGSCNWLSTPYRRVEASVVLRDGRIVGQVLRELGELCFAATRHASLVGELDQLARRLERKPGPAGNAEVGLVLGSEHGTFMRPARDRASRLIWVAADRLGAPAEARALIPLMAAGEGGVEGRLLFSRSVSPLTDEDVADLEFQAAESNVRLDEVDDRVLHGKFLLWDDDDAVITSLNWSSAGTRADNPWSEIGVHVRMPGIAQSVRDRIEPSLRAAQIERANFRWERAARRRRG